MASKKINIGGGIAAFLGGLGLLFKESVGWLVGKLLDLLPLPKNPAGKVNWASIPWVDIAAIMLFVLGVYLFWRGGRMQADSKPANNPHTNIANKAYRIAQALAAYRSAKWFERHRMPDLIPIVREGVAALISFQKAGFATPRLNSDDPEKVAAGLQNYFSAMAPLLSNGHGDVAMRKSLEISEYSDTICDNMKQNEWWTDNG